MQGWPADVDEEWLMSEFPVHNYDMLTGEKETRFAQSVNSHSRRHVYLDGLLAVDWDVDAALFTASGHAKEGADIVDWDAQEKHDQVERMRARLEGRMTGIFDPPNKK